MDLVKPSRRRWWRFIAIIAGAAVVLALLFTSAQPWIPRQRDATAQQVADVRQLVQQIRQGRATGSAVDLVLGAGDLDSIGIIGSQGLRPDRLSLTAKGDRLWITASRPLLGRWFNVRIAVQGRHAGFPDVHAEIGSVGLPAWMTRTGLELARRIIIMRGANLPPLDRMVQSSEVSADTVRLRIVLPRSGLVSQALNYSGLALEPSRIVHAYCRLAAEQRATPDPLLSHQLRRALAMVQPTPTRQAEALVALAMLTVDPAVGGLAGDIAGKTLPCAIPVPNLTLQGRSDWAKHWSLSAALTVTAGNRLAVALGEWKELSDSLASTKFLAQRDPSGFSYADLAVDHSGFWFARRLIDPSQSSAARAAALSMRDSVLLPDAATHLNDGMTNAEFLRRFGATDDPRFVAEVKRIDNILGVSTLP